MNTQPHTEMHQRGRGRFAPSPTGDFHLGNIRTALLAWGYARNAGLGFIVRMDDIDERSRPEYVTSQLADMEALGIEWDGDIEFQSHNQERYADTFRLLRERGMLYECYCTRREILAAITSAPHGAPGAYTGTCRNMSESERNSGRAKLAGVNREPAWRLRAEVTSLAVHDSLAGDYVGAVDDFIVRRSDSVFSYNFTSVIDDGIDGITQIVRGDDLLPSTPRQAYLADILGYVRPDYIHVPLALNTRGARLAKRDGAVTMRALAEYGWTPADIIRCVGESLGFSEVRTAEEFRRALATRGLVHREAWVVDPAALTGESAAYVSSQ